jgi:hypothetical protein
LAHGALFQPFLGAVQADYGAGGGEFLSDECEYKNMLIALKPKSEFIVQVLKILSQINNTKM